MMFAIDIYYPVNVIATRLSYYHFLIDPWLISQYLLIFCDYCTSVNYSAVYKDR